MLTQITIPLTLTGAIFVIQTGVVHAHAEEHDHHENLPAQRTSSVERMKISNASNTNDSCSIALSDFDINDVKKAVMTGLELSE